MKLYLVFSILIVNIAIAQNEFDYIFKNASKFEIEKYSAPDEDYFLVIPSSFSKGTLKKIPFTDLRIQSISLVYSTFSEDSSFDQAALDKRRIEALIKINPAIAKNQFIDWKLIAQTGCNSSTACLDLFHGFVIEYQPYATINQSITEIDSIKQSFEDLSNLIRQNADQLSYNYEEIPCEYPSPSYTPKYLIERIEKFYNCDQKYKAKVFFTAQVNYLGTPENVEVNGYKYDCEEHLADVLKKVLKWDRGLLIGNQQYNLEIKGSVQFPLKDESITFLKHNFPERLIEKHRVVRKYPHCLAYNADTVFTSILDKIERKDVFRSFERNNWSLQNVVVDATASMYPYTTDLLKWIRLHQSDEPARFVFFNDGDDKPTTEKVIGNTGGLYHIFSANLYEIKNTLFQAMKKGGGGDFRENDIEGIISLMNKDNPQPIIWIADNLSFPRDIELLTDTNNTPLRIILCGTDRGINTDYLNLSLRENISLHTLNTDLNDLKTAQIGKTIIIDGKKYLRNSTGFVQRN